VFSFLMRGAVWRDLQTLHSTPALVIFSYMKNYFFIYRIVQFRFNNTVVSCWNSIRHFHAVYSIGVV
jgi:hypothetical protein